MTHNGTDAVLVLVPEGKRDHARRFYEILGFVELPPGFGGSAHGAWLARGDVRLHLGEAADRTPLGPVDLAIEADNPLEVAERCWNAGYSVDVARLSPERERLVVVDPFGNRVELIGPYDAMRSAAVGEGE